MNEVIVTSITLYPDPNHPGELTTIRPSLENQSGFTYIGQTVECKVKIMKKVVVHTSLDQLKATLAGKTLYSVKDGED